MDATQRADLAIRGGVIATASSRYRADIGVRDGRMIGSSTPATNLCCLGASTCTSTLLRNGESAGEGFEPSLTDSEETKQPHRRHDTMADERG
jgi:hypothetical protein